MSFLRRATAAVKGWAEGASDTFHSTHMAPTGPRVPNNVVGTMTVDGVPPHIPEIWGYYDAVGEFHFDAGFLANCLARCTLRLGVLDKENKIGPAFDENGKALDGVPVRLADRAAKMIAGLRSAPPSDGSAPCPSGGHGLLLSRTGANLLPAGMCYWVATKTPTGEHWEVLSTMEMQPVTTPEGQRQQWRRRRHRGGKWEPFAPNFYLPIFVPHPAWSGEADTAALSMLSTLERLHLLNMENIADSKSRLKGPGVEWVPSEIDFPSTDDDPNADEYVSRQFIKAASIGIREPDKAAAHVPIVMRAPGERIKQIVHQRFDYGTDDLISKRSAAVGDLARGTPLPYETTVGYGDTSFANAFAIEGQLARIFISPLLDLITGFLTVGWLTKGLMLATNEALPPEQRLADPFAQPPSEDIRRLVVWYDLSELVTDPDPTKVAMWAYGTDTNPNNVINAKGVRRLLGVPEAEAPSPEETAARMERAQKLRARAEQGDNRPDTDPDSGEPEKDQGDGKRDKDEEVGKRVMALAETMVTMAVDTAGSKLRGKVKGNPSLWSKIDGVAPANVFATLGTDTVETLGGTGPLLNGAFSAFERTVTAQFVDAGRTDAADLAAKATEMAKRATLARLSNPAAVLDVRLAADFLDLLINPEE